MFHEISRPKIEGLTLARREYLGQQIQVKDASESAIAKALARKALAKFRPNSVASYVLARLPVILK
jgi:hypothetical protein